MFSPARMSESVTAGMSEMPLSINCSHVRPATHPPPFVTAFPSLTPPP
jgi:hypothetical protein